jgi:uncharacterized protein
MTPDERQLLSGLFDRMRTASGQPRDREAEAFIGDAVRNQPYAPYLLAQTVIVQDQALRAANERLQELEAKLQSQSSGTTSSGDTSFLGGLGRSIFGGGSDQQPRSSVPNTGYQQPNQGGFGGGYAQQPQGPWGQGAPAQGGAGGGFLKGALGAAAGVAGGVLLANSISGLFRGNPYGIASGVPGMGGFGGGGETVINNYYENDAPADFAGGSGDDGNFDPAADFGPDDASFGSDDDYNV